MNSKSFWLIGLVIVIVGSLINGQLIVHNIGGLLRELMRLAILSGIAVFIFGIIKAVKGGTRK